MITVEQEGVLLWEEYRLSALAIPFWGLTALSCRRSFWSSFPHNSTVRYGVANNGVSAGINLGALFLRFFTIRRGIILMSALAFIIQPWQL
jgi:NCS1 family nucleobase:cation symporter-1